MTASVVTYVADGSTDEFDVTFPFIDRSHVAVTVNGTPPILAPQWVGESRIKLRTILVKGSLVEIRRRTPLDTRLVDFQNGSVLTEEELDKAINQVFYVQQELKDLYDGTLNSSLIKVAQNGGVTSINPDTLMDELVADIIERNVVLDLTKRIADINLNASSIIKTANRVDALQAVVDQITTASGGDLATFLIDEQQERIDGDTALAASLSLIGARSEDGTSWILDQNSVKLSPTESLASRLSSITARLNGADASITAETNARVDAVAALASQFNSLYTRMGNAESAITQEASSRAAADDAGATLRNALAARVSAAEAAIQTEQNVRASGDVALASTLSLLGVKNANGTAFILDEGKVIVGGGVSLASRLSGLSANFSSAMAAVAAEQVARANGDSSLASSITQVQSSLNGVSNTVSVLQSSINGQAGRFAVRIDQNANAVAGFELIGGGNIVSTFRILADKLELVSPGGQGFRPFYVENGVTYIDTAYIKNAVIDTAKIKNGAATDIGTFFGNLNGWYGRNAGGTAWVWYDLRDGSNNLVQATVAAGGADSAKALIDFTWVGSRDGGDDDNLGLRIVRSDGIVLPMQLDNVQIASGKRTYTARFYDAAVPSDGAVTYRVQFQSQGDGYSYWYNVALTVTVFKK